MEVSLRQKVVQEARSWQGTPFAHFQCCKGAGVDCAHLVIGVGKAVGIFPQDFSVPYYSPQWVLDLKARLLLDTLSTLGFTEKPPEARLPGDVLVFEVGALECHVGIFVGHNEMVHAHHTRVNAGVRRFILKGHWSGVYLKRAFVYPGVES